MVLGIQFCIKTSAKNIGDRVWALTVTEKLSLQLEILMTHEREITFLCNQFFAYISYYVSIFIHLAPASVIFHQCCLISFFTANKFKTTCNNLQLQKRLRGFVGGSGISTKLILRKMGP